MQACGCGDAAVSACHLRIQQKCQGRKGLLGIEAQKALAKGWLSYDGWAARQLLNQLQAAQMTCQDTEKLLGWTLANLLEFGGVLKGTRSPGAECPGNYQPFSYNTCEQGICLQESSGDKFRCRSLVPVGEFCAEKSLCFDANERSLPTLNKLSSWSLTAQCVPISGMSYGQCQGKALDEMPGCSQDSHCQSGYCTRIPSRPTNLIRIQAELSAKENRSLLVPVHIYDRSAQVRVLALNLENLQQRSYRWQLLSSIDKDVLAAGKLVFDKKGRLVEEGAELREVAFRDGEIQNLRVIFGSHDSLPPGLAEPTSLSATATRILMVQVNGTNQAYCRPKALPGEQCRANHHCRSQVCLHGICAEASERVESEACTMPHQCLSGVCGRDGSCKPQICRGPF